MVGPPISM
ncbi:hypothetical protein D046_7309A, partial [Vibrio parahaemolyticus V-223/04]